MVPVIKKILFATDLSETAKHSFQYAVAMANKWECELLVAHVVKADTPVSEAILKMSMGEDLYKEFEQKKSQSARDILIGKRTEAQVISEAIRKMFSEAEQHLGQVETVKIRDIVIEAKSVSAEILKIAETEGCDLLVLGHRKQHLLTKGLGEGTLKKVLKSGALPVLVIPPPE